MVAQYAPLDLADPDDAEFWIALAVAQHETGRLDDYTRDHALAAIDQGVDVDEWGRDSEPRRRALARARAKLTGPQPKPKRLRRPPNYSVAFDLGDVVAYAELGYYVSRGDGDLLLRLDEPQFAWIVGRAGEDTAALRDLRARYQLAMAAFENVRNA
jgi:hypothetical protein